MPPVCRYKYVTEGRSNARSYEFLSDSSQRSASVDSGGLRPLPSGGHAAPGARVRSGQERWLRVADKSPRKVASKKSGKTVKEKRRDKKDKQQVRKGLTI